MVLVSNVENFILDQEVKISILKSHAIKKFSIDAVVAEDYWAHDYPDECSLYDSEHYATSYTSSSGGDD
jgi:hypothetical protein